MRSAALRDSLFLARQDLKFLFRDRSTWVWAFIMPLIFFYFIGTITSGFARPAAPPALAFQAAPDAGFMADLLAVRLAERGYRVVKVASDEQAAGYTRRLSVPAGFTANVLAGKPVQVKLTRSGGGLDASYDQFRAGRAVYSLLADLVVVTVEKGEATSEAMADLPKRPRMLTVEVTSAGRRAHPPVGFEQSVPGTMVQFMLLTMLTTGAVWLVVERKQGILRRLASSPMSRASIVWGKCLARFVLGAVQIAFAVIAGAVLFNVRWGPNLWIILIVLAGYAALGVAASVLLGAVARTEGQAIGIGVLSTNILAALGGCWWPIEVTPRWAQAFSLALPTGWAMDALHKLVSFGDSASSVVPHLTAFAVAALVAGFIAARKFRFD